MNGESRFDPIYDQKQEGQHAAMCPCVECAVRKAERAAESKAQPATRPSSLKRSA